MTINRAMNGGRSIWQKSKPNSSRQNWGFKPQYCRALNPEISSLTLTSPLASDLTTPSWSKG